MRTDASLVTLAEKFTTVEKTAFLAWRSPDGFGNSELTAGAALKLFEARERIFYFKALHPEVTCQPAERAEV
jgi:hypothetical protein